MRPLARVLAAPFLWLGLPPTAVTISALVPAAIAVYFMWRDEYAWALVAGGVAAFLDMIDGAVARASHRVTALGGYLDSVIDRVVDVLFLFGYGLAIGTETGWGLVGLGTIGSYGTSYAKARAYEDLRAPAQGWNQLLERPERLMVLGLGVIGQIALDVRGRDLFVLPWFLGLFAAGTLVTLVQRVLKVRRLLRASGQG